MRVLVVTNSYPTAHSPDGAPYITARIRALRAQHVDVTSVALVPVFSRTLTTIKRSVGSHTSDAVALASSRSGADYVPVHIPWGLREVVASKAGLLPRAALQTATAAVMALPEVSPGGFDVVHAHGMYSLPAGGVAQRVARLLDVPYAVTMHGSDVMTILPAVGEAGVKILRGAGATSYVSEALRDRALHVGAPQEGSYVIPNGVDLDVFSPGEARAGGGEERPRLLFVGNLLEVKGADRLPKILHEVQKRLPGATLDVVGSGREEGRLRGIPGLTLRGRLSREDVAAAMRASDVLVVPSRSEGWGCVVTESYACGTPVVASNVGGLQESVCHSDYLVDIASESEVGKAFATVIERALKLRLDPEGLHRHVQDLGWGSIAKHEFSMLEGMLR